MKKRNIIFISTTFLAILLLLIPATGLAQGQIITAGVDRATLSTDDTLTLTVAVSAEGMNAPQPVLPQLQGFTLTGSSNSSQISLINGAISSQVIYTYYLQPTETGNLTIDPVSVTLNGQTFSTDPMTVQVTQGQGQSGGGAVAPSPLAPAPNFSGPTSPDFTGQKAFVEAEVDNPAPYLGEQVIYTFRFYQALDVFDILNQPQFEPPGFTGFWVENTEQSTYQVQVDGRYYKVSEIRTTLFPSVMGPVTIEPARLVIPDGFFSRGGKLQTQPVALEVQPLPPDAPDSFNGAVGQFTLEATVDTTQSKVNEPITWQVTLSGWGNLNSLGDPVWPDLPAWRSFESEATTNTQFQNGRLEGSRVYERLLVPQAEGEDEIPALEYSYFDPVEGVYQTLTAPPIPVSIEPGQAIDAAASNTASAPGVAQETVEQIAGDIRHLKPVPAELSPNNSPITDSPLYWLAWVVPVAALAGNFIWQRRQRYWQNNVDVARSSRAYKKAKNALAQARRDRDDVYSATGQVLAGYLADKLNQPVAGLTQQALATHLAAKGLKPELVDRVSAYLVDAELGRFAPDADDLAQGQDLLKEAKILLRDLEKAL